jgi:hypothetical protein
MNSPKCTQQNAPNRSSTFEMKEQDSICPPYSLTHSNPTAQVVWIKSHHSSHLTTSKKLPTCHWLWRKIPFYVVWAPSSHHEWWANARGTRLGFLRRHRFPTPSPSSPPCAYPRSAIAGPRPPAHQSRRCEDIARARRGHGRCVVGQGRGKASETCRC